MPGLEQKLVIITGANTGVGLSAAERLLIEAQKSHVPLKICLACRNLEKAKEAKKQLHAKVYCSDDSIEIRQVDTSSVRSVLEFTKEIKNVYSSVEYMYLNAGIMPTDGFNFDTLKTFDIKHIINQFLTGGDILHQVDYLTNDGLQGVFATNVFGHFLMIHELLPLLKQSKTRIVWTGSSAAKKKSFSLDDVQHKLGTDPYGSSKYVCDALTVEINRRFGSDGITCYSCCPGLVMSQVTYNIMPWFVWQFIVPFLALIRLFVPFYTLTAHNGAEGLVYLSTLRETESVTPTPATDVKYFSGTSILNTNNVNTKPFNIDSATSDQIYRKMVALRDEFVKKYEEK